MNLEILSKKIKLWANKEPYISAIILFGSRAKGTATEESDWDICCIINENSSETWYGIWVEESESWKKQFCLATNLPEPKVQFVAPTSEQVINGLFECSKVLYIRNH